MEFGPNEEHIIEAVLFASGSSLSPDQLSHITVLSPATCKAICHVLQEKYNAEDRGMQILELEGRFQMTTRAKYYEYVGRLVRSVQHESFTDSQLEVLSIIAYKQPVTKQEIEDIRGVQSDAIVSKLIEYGVIEEVGRLKAPGRPVLFGTSEQFLKNFGFQSIHDLPGFPEDSQNRMNQIELTINEESPAIEPDGVIET